jgi:hypothetical protein
VTLKLVGREILSVVKLGGEKWGVGGRAVPFLPIPSRVNNNFFFFFFNFFCSSIHQNFKYHKLVSQYNFLDVKNLKIVSIFTRLSSPN